MKPETWWKLIKTCKLFYSKQFAIPVTSMVHKEQNQFEIYTSKENTLWEFWHSIGPHSHIFLTENSPKIWIYGRVALEKVGWALLAPHIYKLTPRQCELGDQDLSWEELQGFRSHGPYEYLSFQGVAHNPNGTIATLDKILGSFRSVENIRL